MLRPIIEANWFTYVKIKAESKIAALIAQWVKDFYEKGLKHKEEEELLERQEAAKPKRNDKVLSASEMAALNPVSRPKTSNDAAPRVEINAIKIEKTEKKKNTPRAKLNPALYQNAKLQKELNAKRKDNMVQQLGKYVNFAAKPKLTMKELRAMNDVDAKKDYMNLILAADKQTAEKLAAIASTANEAGKDMDNAEGDIKKVADDFKGEMKEINDHINAKANENGISKDQYYKNYDFKEFNIGRAVPRSKCEQCKKGLKCEMHTFSRQKTAVPAKTGNMTKGKPKMATSSKRL